MAGEWRETTIGEQVLLQRGIDITKVEQRSGAVPVISSGGILSYHDTPAQFGPGVVLGRKGVVGSVWFVQSAYWPHDTTLWVKDFHNNNPRFVYYFFKWMAPKLAALDVGSANPTLNRNHVHPIEVLWPPLPTQRAIAKILGSLDDKIDLNRRMNETLEAMARALFKSWFVDFDGVAKADLQEGTLGQFVDIKRGGSPRPIQDYLSDTGYRWLKISDVSSLQTPFVFDIKEHIKESGLNKTVFRKAGTLVLSNSATPGIPKILSVDTCIHDGWLYFPQSKFSNEFLYLFFKHIRQKLVALGNGSVFTNLKTDILKAFPVTYPGEEVLTRFDEIVVPLFHKMEMTTNESRTLTALRDTLLPKLLSGELRVRDAERIAEVAT
jgi:type I restriction enzyme S subunit